VLLIYWDSLLKVRCPTKGSPVLDGITLIFNVVEPKSI
jgi:hypothetical protein